MAPILYNTEIVGLRDIPVRKQLVSLSMIYQENGVTEGDVGEEGGEGEGGNSLPQPYSDTKILAFVNIHQRSSRIPRRYTTEIVIESGDNTIQTEFFVLGNSALRKYSKAGDRENNSNTLLRNEQILLWKLLYTHNIENNPIPLRKY